MAIAIPGGLAAGEPPSRGEAVYELLRGRRVLEPYLEDLVAETAATLVGRARDWPRSQVNGAYVAGSVNVYLVDGDRLPEENILDRHGIDLTGRRFSQAIVDEETRIIFVDTRFLKEFVAYRMLVDRGEDGLQSAAFVRVRGLPGLREVWDPRLNPELASRRYRDLWLIAVRGMLAFVLGHEMGHIAIGAQASDGFDDTFLSTSKEERDFRWACPELTDPSHRRKQDLERRADDYAVHLIGQVLFPDDIEPRLLLYELGAHQYLSYQLKNELLNAILQTERQPIHRMMGYMLGEQLYSALLARGEQQSRGSVHVFYPRSHPATLNRVMGSLRKLTSSRHSSFHGDSVGFEADFMLLNRLIGGECDRLRARHPSP